MADVSARIKGVFQSLNDDVGLGLSAPDCTASPAERKQWADKNSFHYRCNQIWSELQFQYYQGDIDSAVQEFHVRAKQIFSHWVPKPRADPSTLPTTSMSCRAQNGRQAEELQELLRDILLERRKTIPQRAPRLLSKAHSDGAVLDRNRNKASPIPTAFTKFTAPSHPRVKRSSDDDSSEETGKKPRLGGAHHGGAKLSVQGATSNLDSVMFREHFSQKSSFSGPSYVRAPHDKHLQTAAKRSFSPVRKQSTHARSANASSTSLTSASTSFSAVFSTTGDDALLFNTQTTVEASSQEQQRPQSGSPNGIRPFEAGAPMSSDELSDTDLSVYKAQGMWEAEQERKSMAPRSLGPKNRLQHLPLSSLTASPESSPEPSPEVCSIYSSWPGSSMENMVEQEQMMSEPAPAPRRDANSLQERLDLVWPKFPDWLKAAPLAVAWEICRVALHCEVDLGGIQGMSYDPAWEDQEKLWPALYKRLEFRKHAFPEKSSKEAWAAALDSFTSRGQIVVLSAVMDFNMAPSGPLFVMKMLPLKLDTSSRLSRRFGSDRFLEILLPSPNSTNVPPALRGEDAREAANKWLTRGHHSLAGRQWAAFYTKDAGYKQPAVNVSLSPESAKAVFKDRTYFFAVDGHGFRAPSPRDSLPPKDQKVTRRTKLSVHSMLDWLLEMDKSKNQAYLRLFSRIALGLSKTYPTVTFEKTQILARQKDLLSPRPKRKATDSVVGMAPADKNRNVMNDGVGRMSRSVARKIQEILGLDILPCAVQGRLGSAKGMWIIDVKDLSGEDWIETYPSQRKWNCNLDDPDHRTLEVRNHASELHPARLNLQFLPVLEDRSKDKAVFRSSVGGLLKDSLQAELEGLRVALNRPIQHRQWVHENSMNRESRIRYRKVPSLGGMPDSDEEAINMMLDHGFDPKKQKYLQDMAWTLQKQKCETLKKKLNISIGRSAYAYMVVDFLGILEEDEVHMCFSNRFQAGDFADTLLDDIDVLVARSPAHYISDVQKVKAVFKPALKELKDVIVFPRKGKVALADKLSGGDYDGDLAWVCWDQAIVANFVNSPVPQPPNLFEMGYLNKIDVKMEEIVTEHGPEAATSEMVERSFMFNTRQNYLGICTNFKEKLCYKRRNVHDDVAVLLSTLLSNLVDQSKQGIEFSAEKLRRLRRDLGEDRDLDLPLYREGNWAGTGEPDHIIDYLKFAVAKPLIDSELGSFHKAISGKKSGLVIDEAHYFDPDLTVYANWFSRMKSESVKKLLTRLEHDIHVVEVEWKQKMALKREAGTGEGVSGGGGDPDYRRRVLEVHEKWCAIQPDTTAHKALAESKVVAMLEQPFLHQEDNQWALLRASMAFKLFYNKGHKFVWRMAGRQLMRLKSLAVAQRLGEPAVSVVPEMYAALRPDSKMIKRIVAMEEGNGSHYTGADDSDSWSDHGDDGLD